MTIKRIIHTYIHFQRWNKCLLIREAREEDREQAIQLLVKTFGDEYTRRKLGSFLERVREQTRESGLELCRNSGGRTPAITLRKLGMIDCSEDIAEKLDHLFPVENFISYFRF